MMKGGFGGMNPGNFQNLMKQAQKMQAQLAEQAEQAEEELNSTVLTATSGGGMVTVKMTGKRQLQGLTINPQAVDPDDVELLEDLIVSALNDVLKQADELESKLKPNLPNGF